MNVIKQIDKYELSYFADPFCPSISLISSGKFSGQIIFVPDSSNFTGANLNGDHILLRYKRRDFPIVIDLLRNEKPVYWFYDDRDPGLGGLQNTESRREGSEPITEESLDLINIVPEGTEATDVRGGEAR